MTANFSEAFKFSLLLIKHRARVFSYSWATLIGALVASRGIPPIVPTLGAVASISAVALSIYVFNDVADLSIDRVNEVDRPLAQGKVSENACRIFAAFFAIVGTILGLFINSTTFLLCLACIAVGYSYSIHPIRLKDRFMLKQTSIASGAFFSSLIGGAAVGNLSWSVIFAGFMFFAYAFSMSPVVDIGDMKGDMTSDRRTLPVTFGPKNTVKTAIIFMFILTASSIIGFFQLGFNIAFPIMTSLVCLLCAWFLYPLLHHWQDLHYARIQLKKWVFIHFTLQFAIIVGALPLPI